MNETKHLPPVLTTEDVRDRYRCGKNLAQKYVREIKAYNGGGALGRGRVTAEEVYRFERRNLAGTTEKTNAEENGGTNKWIY